MARMKLNPKRMIAQLTLAATLCLSAFGASSVKDAASDGGYTALTVFHTNDIHSHMNAPLADEFKLGGLPRLATLLTDLRAKRETSITLDAGDWSEGSWAYNIDTGANMLRILDKLGFDAVVVGNHDFLSGPDRLLQTVKEASPRFPVLASNLNFSQYTAKQAEFRAAITPSVILERGGLKIGVIGLTTVDPTYGSFLLPLVATDPMLEAKARVAELRPLVDVLIVLSHNKFEMNVELARSVKGIDAVVSGHSHKKVSQAVTVQNAGRTIPIVETGKWGTFLGDLRFLVNRATKQVEYSGYELHAVLPSLAPNDEVEAMIKAEDKKLTALYGSDIHAEVADSEVELDDVDSHHASLGDLTTKAYRAATNADVGLELMALTGVKTPAGALTVESLHDVMPHILNFKTGKEWTLKVLNVKGLDLAMMLGLFYSGGGDLPIPFAATGALGSDGLEIAWEQSSLQQRECCGLAGATHSIAQSGRRPVGRFPPL